MKLFSKKLNDPQFLLLAYKISHDVLFLVILSFIAALFLEAVLPGMVADNNGFLILSSLAFAMILSITKIGGKMEIEFKDKKKHRLLPFVLTGAFILIGNSLLKFSLWENLLITTTTLFVFFLIYYTIFPEEK